MLDPAPSSEIFDAIFTVGGLLTALFSFLVVAGWNPVRCTLFLIMAFLPTSLLYVMLRAPFVAILQVLVYAGAIMMLFTFVVMMVNPRPEEGELGHLPGAAANRAQRVHWKVLLPLAAAGVPLVALVRSAANNLPPGTVPSEGFGELSSISRLLFERPMDNPLTVSFELISFLVLVGIIAAVNFSRRDASQGKGSH